MHITLQNKIVNKRDLNLETEERATYFRRIISQNSIYDDYFLAFCEPAIGSEPGFSLGWGGRHHEECCDAEDESDETPKNESPINHLDMMYSNVHTTYSMRNNHLQPSLPSTPLM